MQFNNFRENFFSNCIYFNPFLSGCPFNNDRLCEKNEVEFNPVKFRLVPIEDLIL